MGGACPGSFFRVRALCLQKGEKCTGNCHKMILKTTNGNDRIRKAKDSENRSGGSPGEPLRLKSCLTGNLAQWVRERDGACSCRRAVEWRAVMKLKDWDDREEKELGQEPESRGTQDADFEDREPEEALPPLQPWAKAAIFMGLTVLAAVICAVLWHVTHPDKPEGGTGGAWRRPASRSPTILGSPRKRMGTRHREKGQARSQNRTLPGPRIRRRPRSLRANRRKAARHHPPRGPLRLRMPPKARRTSPNPSSLRLSPNRRHSPHLSPRPSPRRGTRRTGRMTFA